jgi:hypothetical protein
MICCFRRFLTIVTKYVDSTHYGQILELQVREGVIENKMSHLLATLDPSSTPWSPHCRRYPLPSLAALYQYLNFMNCFPASYSSAVDQPSLRAPTYWQWFSRPLMET